jgi:hypothetical protein
LSYSAGETIGVSPTRIHAEVEPGGTYRDRVNLINGGVRETWVRPLVRAMRRDDSHLSFMPSPQCAWVRLEEAEIFLPAGESRTVDLSVKVPEGESPGTYSLAVIFQQEGAGREGLMARAALAVTLELVVLPPAPADGGRGFPLFPLFLLVLTLLLFPALVVSFLKIGRRLLSDENR